MGKMFICYIDESGTPEIPGNSTHFVLAGLAIPINKWKSCDMDISAIKKKYFLQGVEIHTGWMMREYSEQTKIVDFAKLNKDQRIYEVEKLRNIKLMNLQRAGKSAQYKLKKKNYNKTKPYIHLTHDDRKQCILDIGKRVSRWQFARLFAECIDKLYFDPVRIGHNVETQGFEQVISRFEQFLQIQHTSTGDRYLGLLIHDNNETVSKKHTELMKEFHRTGTLWTTVTQIIETPLFVDSQLTSMVQIADVCSYALRRYLENQEAELFSWIFQRADRKDGVVVGIRHFVGPECKCKICSCHRKKPPKSQPC
jgi:hypothetical protein